MTIWAEQRLVGLIKAMRHLPPGTRLPKYPHKLENEILMEILGLNDEIDLIKWTTDKYKRLAARVLLWDGLSYLRDTLLGMNSARQSGQDLLSPTQQWLNILLDLPEGQIETLFELLLDTNPLTVADDILTTVLQGLQNLYAGRDEVNRLNADNDLFDFMHRMLHIRASADPIQYIELNFQHLASVQTLRYLIAQLQIPPSQWTGKSLKTYKHQLQLNAAGIAVTLQEVALYPIGFTLTLSAHIPKNLIPQSPMFRYISWEGIESISDNLGSSYMIWYRLPQGKGLSLRYDQNLQLLCYPTLTPLVADLTLQSTQMAMLFMGSSAEGHGIKVLKTLDLGDLKWNFRLSVPANL